MTERTFAELARQHTLGRLEVPRNVRALAGVRDGDLAVGDPWADLAIASLSLDWNFGEGHQGELFDACGIAPGEERIRYYRALWELAS